MSFGVVVGGGGGGGIEPWSELSTKPLLYEKNNRETNTYENVTIPTSLPCDDSTAQHVYGPKT